MAVPAIKAKRHRGDSKKVSVQLGLAIPPGLLVDRTKSLAATVALLPLEAIQALFEGFSDDELLALEADWRFWARPDQIAPEGDWSKWLILAGRGWGKTRTGAEFIIEEIRSGRASRVALVGRTAADVRDVMIEGESGILACSPEDFKPIYEPSKRRLTWPNGAIATAYSGDEPNLLRGPQHDLAWADEAAAWRYTEAWDNLIFGLRLGKHPRVIITTTPKPTPLIKDLVSDPKVFITKGKTQDNAANLADSFIAEIERKYAGTRLGRQEMDGELLDDVKGALWTRKRLDELRVASDLPDFVRIVVAIDPATTSEEGSDETGIVVAALGTDGHAYVLDDLSLKDSPGNWAKAAVGGYSKHRADLIVGEANNGGDMVELTVRTVDKKVPFKKVHASRGKLTRAEPIAALYEQGKVHHVGFFAELEDQMCTWVPGKKSPDRMDALVWALTELMLGEKETQSGVTITQLKAIQQGRR